MIRYSNSSLWSIDEHTLYAPALSPAAVVLDLGASTAGFSHDLAEAVGCRCHAVEALTQNFERIGETVRVRRHHYAVGAVDGTRTLRVVDEGARSGMLSASAGRPAERTEEVPAISLDTLVAQLGAQFGADVIDLAKIDVEGAEFEMFDAASDGTLQRFAQMTVEFHDFMDRSRTKDVRRILARLRRLGFREIVFSRRFHGDVLLINRAHVRLSVWRFAYFRYGVRNARGLRRLAGRLLQRGRAVA